MAAPTDKNALENPVAASSSVGRDPSYPDRARIDSDVRAFLRPASSPWIVFDRDSRIDDFAKSALRVGAVFASRPTMQERIASAAMFPIEVELVEPVAEPSSIVVAADVVVQPAPTTRPRKAAGLGDAALPDHHLVRKGRGRIGAIAAAVGVILGVTALVALRPAVRVLDAPSPVVAAPQIVAPAPVGGEIATVGALPAPLVEASKPAAEADLRTHRLGKLAIKADPKTRNVWFDGKRMLGNGPRTFLVACGMHTIAVNDRKDARDVEVPCNGEYAIGGK